MGKSTVSVQLNANGADKFVANLTKAEEALTKFVNATKQLSGASFNVGGVGALGGIGKLNTGIAGVAKNAQGLGSKIAGVGSKIAGVFGTIVTGALLRVGAIITDLGARFIRFGINAAKFTVKFAGDFEQALQQFSAIGGKDLTGGALEQFKGLFKSFAGQGVDALQAANAGIELLKGGLKPAIIQQSALKDALNLAKIGFLDQASAAEILATQYAAWGAKGVTTTQIVDQLSRVDAASTVGVADLAQGIANATNSIASFADTSAAIGFIRKNFTSARDAGTGYRNFLNNLQPTTKSAINAQKKLGLYSKRTGSAFFDSAGEFIGNEKAAALLEKATRGLTSEQKQLALKQAFSADGQRVAIALAEGGAKAYASYASDLALAASAQEKADKFNQGFNASMDRLGATAKNAALGVGEKLLPSITGFIDNALTPGVAALGRFGEKLFSTGGAGDNFIKSLAPIASGVGQFITDVAGGMPIGDALTKQLGSVDLAGVGTSLAKGAGNLIGGLIAGLGQVDIGGALKGLFGKLGGINFGDLFGGIAKGASTISPALGGVISQVSGLFNQLISIGSSVAQRFIAVFQSIGPGLINGISQAFSGVVSIVSGILTQLSGIGQGITQIFSGDILGGINTISTSLAAGFAQVRAGLVNAFLGIISTVGTLIAGLVQALTGVDVAPFVDAMTKGFLLLPTILNGVGAAIGGFFTGIKNSFNKFVTGDFAGAADSFSAAFDGIPAALEKTKADVAAQVASLDAKPPPIDIPPPNTAAFTTGIQQVQQQASGAGTAAIAPITIPAPITTAFTSAITQVQQQASGIGTTAIAPIVIPAPDTSAFASAVTAAQSTANQVKTAFSGISLTAQGVAAGASFASGLRSQAGAASAAGAALVNAARNGANGAAGGFASVGSRIAAGVASGIRASMGSVIAAAVAMVRSAKSAAEAEAGINSPAKEWRKDIGRNMGLGTGLGFIDSMKRVTALIGSGMQRMSTAAARYSQPATSSRVYNRTNDSSVRMTNSNNRTMPVTIISAASAQDSMAALVLNSTLNGI